MTEPVLVHVSLDGRTFRVGRLWIHRRGGRESATFRYKSSWLENPMRFALEPALGLSEGPFHTSPGKALFGAIGDSSPDRWGRMLISRRARKSGSDIERTSYAHSELDYLLSVSDETRQGALRFSNAPDGPFLAEPSASSAPPIFELSRLLSAARHVQEDRETDEELRILLAPGSSLGGARPKASVRDKSGSLCIAKFPGVNDDWSVVLWEAVLLDLAEYAGINAPRRRVLRCDGKPVLLLERFDRQGEKRIPFLSAMSMLDAREHQTRSYLEIADAIRMQGARPKSDLKMLWKRMVFNILASNLDDHLRNHAFLYAGTNGWTLSPVYDLNPVPADVAPRILRTAIGLDGAEASLEKALEVTDYFGIDRDDALEMAALIAEAVHRWRPAARRHGISSEECSRMKSAFHHSDMAMALGR